MIPKTRPKMALTEVSIILHKNKLDPRKEGCVLVGIRGYYKNTMGKPGVNDRGIYDDAMFVVSPDCFVAFNANTDPSRIRKGRGKGSEKGMASLKTGLYRAHNVGYHKKIYPALRQGSGEVTVIRDGIDGDYEDTGRFGINIHPGGINGTSSEGCQTIPRQGGQWDAFIALVVSQLKKYNQKVVPYLLVES